MNNSFKYIMESFSRYWKRTFWKDEKGMGVIEVVLIILVLVGLALVFKNQISGVADGVYKSIKTQIKSF